MSKKSPTNKEYEINENAFLVSKTDTKGITTYCNEPFMNASKQREDSSV